MDRLNDTTFPMISMASEYKLIGSVTHKFYIIIIVLSGLNNVS
jgi:hypothetical protein